MASSLSELLISMNAENKNLGINKKIKSIRSGTIVPIPMPKYPILLASRG
jgi:hypothetical protein